MTRSLTHRFNQNPHVAEAAPLPPNFKMVVKLLIISIMAMIVLSCKAFPQSSGTAGIQIPVTMTQVNQAIDSFSHTLDSVVVKQRVTINAAMTSVDTISCAVDQDAVYWIYMKTKNPNNHDGGDATKLVHVRNVGGQYSIVRDVNSVAYAGQGTVAGANWFVAMFNNKVTLYIRGVANRTINWTIAKQSQF